MGALNAGIPFTLIGVSELTLPASYASVLNATMPLFSVVLARQYLHHAVTGRQVVGLATGVLGVAVVVGAAPFPLSPAVLGAVAASTVAAASYACAAVFVRRRMAGVAPLDLTVGQQVTAAAWLLPLAAFALPTARFPAIAVEAVVAIALISTVFANIVYFHLLQRVGPTSASTVTFLMPVFGVVWGNLLLSEPIGLGLVGGFALVLLGVALVTATSPPPPFVRRTATP